MTKTERELLLRNLIDTVKCETGITMFPEYRFHGARRWRFDLATSAGILSPGPMVALEIEGGVYVQGRHVRGVGYEKDMEKYNEAQLMGWTVLRCTWRQVKNGYALKLLERALHWGPS